MILNKRAGDTISLSRFRWRYKDELEHRANRVKELQGQGYNIPQIAQKLQVSVPTIKRISARLHKESRENYQRLVQEQIPYEVDSTLELYKSIKRQTKELAEKTDNEQVKVRALDLMQRAGKEYIDLKMRGDIIKKALDVAEYIQKKLNELPSPPQTQTQHSENTNDEEELEEGEGEEEAVLPLYDHE